MNSEGSEMRSRVMKRNEGVKCSLSERRAHH